MGSSGTARRGALLFNPAAGRRRQGDVVPSLIAVLRAHGWEVEPLPTEGPGTAPDQVRNRIRRGDLAVLFAYGGDGTLREAAQGLLGSPVALAPLPGGTTNVICHSLGLPRDPIGAADGAASGRVREIAVGMAADQAFLMQASAGADAAVMAAVSGEAKARWGRAAVVVEGLALLRRYRFPPIDVSVDGDRLSGGFVAVANLPHYAGPFELATVGAEEPELELVVHRATGPAAALSFTVDLLRGRHGARPDVLRRRVVAVTLLGPAGTHLQIDGDVCAATLPVGVRVAPARLRVLLPRGGVPVARRAGRR